jgi:hypothetical protein
VLFYAGSAIVDHIFSVISPEKKDHILTSSTWIEAGKESDNSWNESTESFEKSSLKDVMNESINEPNVAVS